MPDWNRLPEYWNPLTDSNRWQSALIGLGTGAATGATVAGVPTLGIGALPGMAIGGGIGLVTGLVAPNLYGTNADINRWAEQTAANIPEGIARDSFLNSIRSGMNRGEIHGMGSEARSAGRQADRQRAQERNYFDFMGNMRADDRSHELNMMNQYANMMGGQAQANAQMRGLEAGLNYNLGMQGLQSNERIAQGSNATQFDIARDTNATQFGIARDTNATQYDIANLQALNNLDVTDAQGWWNTINTGMTTGANVEMNRENARTSRYNTDRNARSNERMAGMQTALQARDIANRQLNFWSQQYAR